jgi:hypothetical protein
MVKAGAEATRFAGIGLGALSLLVVGCASRAGSDGGASSLGVSASPCQTLTSTSGSIVDSAGNVWTLAPSPDDGLVIDKNGAPAGFSANVARLVYANDVVSQENIHDGWWFWNGKGWTAESGPGACDASPASQPSPACTSLVSTSGVIFDSSGNRWTLVAGADGSLVVDENGAAAGFSDHVTRLVYVNERVSQENDAHGWWSWANGTWNAEGDPTGSCMDSGSERSGDAGNAGSRNDASGGHDAGTVPDSGGRSPVASITLTGSQTASLRGDTYVLQGDEWNSSAPMTITSDGNVDFRVASDGLSTGPGAPGAYPSLYFGCHWGNCTASSGLPLSVATIESPGTVTTSIVCTNDISGRWDNSYDIWFNAAATTNDNGADGLEMMVWLADSGGTRPAGSEVATNAPIAGHSFNVYYGSGGTSSPLLSYQLATQGSSFTDLDIGALAADAVSRGYLSTSHFLIDVEAGFELWSGGDGLSVNSFSVTVH